MKGKREADNNFNFKSEKLDELRSRVDAAFDEHGDEAWEQIKGIFTHPKRLLVAALAAVLLVGVITVGGYLLKIRAPELPNKDNTQKDPNRPQVDEIDYGDGVRPRVSGERKSKDFYTVLVLGRDTGGGGNTDTMLLASYDVTNQKATVMSIPRDTMVNVPWDVKKINSVYNYYGGGDKGIKALYKEISQLVGFEPDYQVVVEWEAVGAIVEAIGGVYGSPYWIKQLYLGYHSYNLRLLIDGQPVTMRERLNWNADKSKGISLRVNTVAPEKLTMRFDEMVLEVFERTNITTVTLLDKNGAAVMQYNVSDLRAAYDQYGLNDADRLVVGGVDDDVMKIGADGQLVPVE